MNKIILLSFLALQCINAQSQTLRRIANEVDGISSLVNSLGRFSKTLGKTSKEFNNTFKVIKEGQPNSSKKDVSKEKLSKLEIKKGKAKNLNWEPVAYFDNQLFPSVIISMAHFNGSVTGSFANSVKSSALGFKFNSNKDFIPIKYEIECVEKKYFDKHSGEFFYQNSGDNICFMPNIPWNFEILARQTTNSPVNIYFRLFDEAGNKTEKLVTLTMRSINDCIFYYDDFNMTFMYSAYIQEKHPAIEKILRDAINTKMVNAFVGYQHGENIVDKQIAAIWRVLHERGFVYSSITNTIGDEGNKVFSQTVRTFENALSTNQANCVDGSVVFASILRNIGIDPLLIIVEGHCFLGYYTSKDKKTRKIKFLETTMLSDSGNLHKAKNRVEENKEYLNIFKNAQIEGKNAYNENISKYLLVIDIAEERKRIKPIPHLQL